MPALTTDFDKILEQNAVRLYRMITAFKNEYGYNTIQSSVRATILLLEEIMQDSTKMSAVEMKMLLSKMTEIELKRRHMPLPKLVQDGKGNKFYDLRDTNLVGRLPGAKTDLKLLELPYNTITILIVTVMYDARLRVVAFTDDPKLHFIEVGDLLPQIQPI